METIEYIPMDAELKLSLIDKYRKPFRSNVIILTVVFVLLYLIIFLSSNGFLKDASVPDSNTGGMRSILFNIGLPAIMFIVYSNVYSKFKKMNIHFLKDAESGMIAKAQMCIINVFDTPSGINIYWLDSPVIKSFTPDPYRTLRNGDVVVIYYLEYSAQYLAYELPANN